MSLELKIVVISSLMTFLGVVGNAMILRFKSRDQSRSEDAAADKAELENMSTIMKVYREENARLLSENIALRAGIDLKNNAIRGVEHERDAYIAYAGQLRRIARKYAPPDVVLPEVGNGDTPPRMPSVKGGE